MLVLLILTLSIILFRFIRLFVKEGTFKKLFIIILLSLSIIFSIIYCGKIEANNKLKQSEEILNTIQHNNIVMPIESTSTQITSIENSKVNNFTYYPNSGEVLGVISIEKILLKLPIIEDSNDENLWLGVAHIRGTPLPWEKGNSFLASHDIKIYGKLFNRLNELTIGDKISIFTSNGNFTYVVYDQEIVPPDDTNCFKKIKGEYNLSLVTCTKSGGKRVIVYSESISQ